MNTVRKLLDLYYDDVKSALDMAYDAIRIHQDRRNIENLNKMKKYICEAVKILSIFKPYIPAYKSKYLEILNNMDELDLSDKDIIMTFDRAVYELHTRLEKHLIDDKWSWSPLMKDILDGRRNITKNKDISGDFLASGKTVVGGYVRASICFLDDLKINKGKYIIATKMTSPDIIEFIPQILGIATEQGGLTCHAAVLAREFGIPCVVGCGKFTDKLINGEEIVLDADNGLIFKSENC